MENTSIYFLALNVVVVKRPTVCFRDDGEQQAHTAIAWKNIAGGANASSVGIDTEQPTAGNIDGNDDIASTDLGEICGNKLLTFAQSSHLR